MPSGTGVLCARFALSARQPDICEWGQLISETGGTCTSPVFGSCATPSVQACQTLLDPSRE
jgi:hypothetical protein